MDAGSHYVHTVPETHVMNEAAKLKGQSVVLEVKLGNNVELRPVQEVSPEERRQKVTSVGRKIMDEYEATFRILAK